MSKQKIEDLACFDDVARVIGLTRAKCELFRVIESGLWLNDFNSGLADLFCWDDSPQGWAFWDRIIWGINPYTRERVLMSNKNL